MSLKHLIFSSVCFGSALALFTTFSLAQEDAAPEAPPADSGYFLSFRQKGQLIWQGRIQDTAGRWYDIWIVPGYVDPARQCRINTIKAGKDFAEYAHKQKYSDLAKNSGDAFEWAYDDCLVDFALEGSQRDWSRNWTQAGERTEKRVFGWWLAYPWAALESTISTIVRLPVGAAGGVLGTAWGSAVVPVYYGVNSAVTGTLRFGVNAVVAPASACVWNTAAAPVMALVGQKPAPARVDGFWVTQFSEEELACALQAREPVTAAELEALAEWGSVLLTAAQPFVTQRTTLRAQQQQERAELNSRFQQAEKELTEAEARALSGVASTPEQAAALKLLRERGFDERKISRAADTLREYLEARGELSTLEIARTLQALRTAPPAATTNALLRAKTDPVDSSIKAIGEIK